MQMNIMKYWGVALCACLVIVIVSLSRTAKTSGSNDGGLFSSDSAADASSINKEVLSNQLGLAIRNNEFPHRYAFVVDGSTKQAKVQYTIQADMQALMEKLMSQYSPDYGAFVAMDARTGRILAMVSHSGKRDLENLNLRATFPAASIFKVVTASAAIDMQKANGDTIVPFNGALHTLYKKNTMQTTKVNKWTRHMTMREAFARSVNTFFGKLGLFYVGSENLQMYAERYMFNQPIHADMPVQVGHSKISNTDPWSVVQAASGYTRDNTMSPIQGALIASVVANDGVMMEPFIVENLVDDNGDALYQGAPRQASVVVEPSSAENLRELFRQTVKSGTSRKSFRQTIRRSAFDDIEFGGKTGSLTGTDPQGKVDWFVGYARYRDQRIAVAALTVNEKKWKVKSSMLANLYFQKYFKDLKRGEQVADRR